MHRPGLRYGCVDDDMKGFLGRFVHHCMSVNFGWVAGAWRWTSLCFSMSRTFSTSSPDPRALPLDIHSLQRIVQVDMCRLAEGRVLTAKRSKLVS